MSICSRASGRVAGLADVLAVEWELSDLEYREVLSWGAAMEMCENDWQDVSAHMEMRAELMHIAGSEYDQWAPKGGAGG